VQTAAVAIGFGCWPFSSPLDELDGWDYVLAVAALQEAQSQQVETRKSLAEYQAGKTIEFLGKAMKKR
jgi:hypothetical protein